MMMYLGITRHFMCLYMRASLRLSLLDAAQASLTAFNLSQLMNECPFICAVVSAF
jgi:hypothetical protein